MKRTATIDRTDDRNNNVSDHNPMFVVAGDMKTVGTPVTMLRFAGMPAQPMAATTKRPRQSESSPA